MHHIVPGPGSVATRQRNPNMVKPRSKVEKPCGKKKTEKSRPEEMLKTKEEHVESVDNVKNDTDKPQTSPALVKEEDTVCDDFDESLEKSVSPNLAENSDYIALTSALSMLTRQQETSKRDLVKLSQMRQQAVEQPEQFLDKVKDGQVAFPKALYVTMVPSIDWNQYDFENRELDAAFERQKKASKQGVVEEVPLFNQ